MIDITEELFHQPELLTTEEVVTGRLTKREMDAVADVIYNWDQWGLGIDFRTEVIWSALNALKRNPEISIAEALDCGIAEWIK